jgi:hypothetical protein
MKGLEPSTFCMANAGDRSLPFALVRSNRLFAAVSMQASEQDRTRANAKPCHPCHGVGRRTGLGELLCDPLTILSKSLANVGQKHDEDAPRFV